jgi:hypothetical protein
MAQGNRRPGRHSRQQSRVASLINGNGKQQHDSSPKATDEATVSYIKRTLCKKHSASGVPADSSDEVDHKSLEELLPPLTSSNEIDQDFVANVVQIIAHCTRGLEQRLRKIDLECLVLEELPIIITQHIDGQFAAPCSALIIR